VQAYISLILDQTAAQKFALRVFMVEKMEVDHIVSVACRAWKALTKWINPQLDEGIKSELIEFLLDSAILVHVVQELLFASLKLSGKVLQELLLVSLKLSRERGTLPIYILIFLCFFSVFFFSVFPDNFRHLCTTMPWTIWPALVVLWGVCWMFYDESVGNVDAVLNTTEQHYALLPDPGEYCHQSCTRNFALTISKRNTGTRTGWQTRAIQFSPTHQTSDNSNTSLPPFTILPYPVQSSTSLVLRM
jgi:hypothetical protein